MAMGNRDHVRERAYHLWKEAGEAHGRDLDHWLKAEQEVASEPAESPEKPTTAKAASTRSKKAASGEEAAPKKSAAPKTKPAAAGKSAAKAKPAAKKAGTAKAPA